MDLSSLLPLLQAINSIVAIIGIPVAIYIYWSNITKERKEREYETYHALDEKYYEYIKLCLQYPELDLFYLPLSQEVKLAPQQVIQKQALFEILISLLERAYVMYSDQSNLIKQVQWNGWRLYIQKWSQREDFRELWSTLAPGYYDERFTKHIDDLIRQTQSATVPNTNRETPSS